MEKRSILNVQLLDQCLVVKRHDHVPMNVECMTKELVA